MVPPPFLTKMWSDLVTSSVCTRLEVLWMMYSQISQAVLEKGLSDDKTQSGWPRMYYHYTKLTTLEKLEGEAFKIHDVPCGF